MNEKRLYRQLHPKKIKRFLLNNPNVVITCDGSDCPVADYLHHKYPNYVFHVGTNTIDIEDQKGRKYSFPTPTHIQTLIDNIDLYYYNLTYTILADNFYDLIN